MWRRSGLIICLTLGYFGLAAEAHADRRVALLMGNAAYASAPLLRNPINDVAAMKAALTKAGFDVVDAQTDLTRVGMIKALRSFEDAVQGAEIGVIFYSGHGIEFKGENYLIPTDAKLMSERDVDDEAVNLDRVLNSLDGATKLKLVLLDACRENPFVNSMKRIATKGAESKGLIGTEASIANMLIAYAAAPGHVALDGAGANSPFTMALVNRLITPGLDVQMALRQVREDVVNSTKQAQVPFETSSLGGEAITLGPPAAIKPPIAAIRLVDPDGAEKELFAFASGIGSVAAWDSFLAKYPVGSFAQLAHSERLKLMISSSAREQNLHESNILTSRPSGSDINDHPNTIRRPRQKITKSAQSNLGSESCKEINGTKFCY